MQEALGRAGLRPEQVDYVNTHGTGTRVNDRAEAAALRALLGAAVERVPCSSTKPVTGHCLGAAAAIEAVISILALEHQLVPPTINCRSLDPECRLDLVRDVARPALLQSVLSTSQGFWGNNAALVFTR